MYLCRVLSLIASLCLTNIAFATVTLNIFEWEGYISPYAADFEAFAKSKGKDIKLNILPKFIGNSEDIFQAVRAKTADVVTPTNNYYHESDNKLVQILYPIDYSKLENYQSLPASLREATYDNWDGKKHSVPLLGGSYGLAYNTALVKEAPTSWEALWDPQYAGKISITGDQYEANIYNTLLVLGYSPETLYDVAKSNLDQAKVEAKLTALVRNTKSFWGGMEDPKEIAPLSLITSYWFGVALANKQGQSWKFADPKEGQTIWLDTLAIAAHAAQNPEKLEAAHLLLDFMISAKAQARLYSDYGSVVVNPLAKQELAAELAEQSRAGDGTFFQEKWFWKPLDRRTGNLYNVMWQNAKKAI